MEAKLEKSRINKLQNFIFLPRPPPPHLSLTQTHTHTFSAAQSQFPSHSLMHCTLHTFPSHEITAVSHDGPPESVRSFAHLPMTCVWSRLEVALTSLYAHNSAFALYISVISLHNITNDVVSLACICTSPNRTFTLAITLAL